jgi:hypothetical protein
MSFLIALAEVAKAVAEITKAIQDVAKTLNEKRSVVIQFENHTNLDLDRTSDHFDHGGYSDPPSARIPANTANIFGAQSSAWSVGTGVEGTVTFAGRGIDIELYFDNPFIGSNASSVTLRGRNSSYCKLVSATGNGNEKAVMKYELLLLDPNRPIPADPPPLDIAVTPDTVALNGESNTVTLSMTIKTSVNGVDVPGIVNVGGRDVGPTNQPLNVTLSRGSRRILVDPGPPKEWEIRYVGSQISVTVDGYSTRGVGVKYLFPEPE